MREWMRRQVPVSFLAYCFQCSLSDIKTKVIFLTSLSGRDLGTLFLKISHSLPCIYKHSSLYHGRMWHDQAPAYLYKDDSQLLASLPPPGTSSTAILKYLPFLNMPCFLTPPCLCTSFSFAWEWCPCDRLLRILQHSVKAQPPSGESFWVPPPPPSRLPDPRPKQSTRITEANFLTLLSFRFLNANMKIIIWMLWIIWIIWRQW